MTTAIPEFRQFGEFSPEDFERNPVWILCHTADYDETWYEDIDEQTFRPWNKEFPATVLRETLLVRANFELWDGSRYTGFVTPLVQGYDTLPDGRRLGKPRHPLGRQQPNIFVAGKPFGFWGGIVGISQQVQREFYAALGKEPSQIFPMKFRAEPGLANGTLAGQIDGFYKHTRDGELQIERAIPDSHVSDVRADLFKIEGSITSGYPQPETVTGYRKAVYSEYCPRCGIYGSQKAPFRFKKSVRGPLKGFMQLNWVPDAFFVAREIADEITRAGITGISFGPSVAGRSAEELHDRVQMLIPTVVACAETSKLPPVTCRPRNEEVVAMTAMLERRKANRSTTTSTLSPSLKEHFRKLKEQIAKIPFCGRLKHHSPTSMAILPSSAVGAPDVFQTAEWFGSGACAFRLTLASRRFADLVRDRDWKGLALREVQQSGFSERE